MSSIDVRLSEAAVTHIESAMHANEDKPALGIRLGVKKAGCSGYEYIVEYVYALGPFDCFVKDKGACLVMDKEIYQKFLVGTLVDFRLEGLNEGLVFDNPNVVGQCGCGESFALKVDMQ